MEDKIKKEFDIKLATRLAGLSPAAYNSSKIFPHSLRSLGMIDDRTGKQGWLFELLENENSQVYVIWSHKEKEIYIAWRGTEPGEYKDVLADLKFRKVIGHQGKVHRGFKGYVDKVFSKVEKLLTRIIKKDRDDWYDIYITGHSLGGASALICTNRLEENTDFVIKSCYTFGGPRALGWGASKWVKTPVWRIRNNNDIVTRVPFYILGYSHVGKMCYIDSDKKLHIGNAKWSMMTWNWIKGHFSRIADSVRDHSVGEYYEILKSHQKGK